MPYSSHFPTISYDSDISFMIFLGPLTLSKKLPVRVDFLRLVEDVEGQESYHDLEVPDDSFAAFLGAQQTRFS